MSTPEPSISPPASLADAHELIHKLQTRVKELEFHRSAVECAKKNAVRKLNDELVKDGVCKLDVIDQTRLVQQAALLAVLHDEPSPVFDFLLADTSQGFWVRTTLETTKDNRIVLWRDTSRGVNVEYLLQLATSSASSTNSGCIILINSVVKESLSKEAFAKYTKSRSSSKSVVGKISNGTIKISPYPHGQSTMSFTGTLESEDSDETSETSKFSSMKGRLKTMRGKGSRMSRKSRTSKLGTFRSSLYIDREPTSVDTNTNRVKSSILRIFYHIKEEFDRPDVIDDRIRHHFVNEIMPNAPSLSDAEKEKLNLAREVEKRTSKAKRLPGDLRSPVEKYLWNEVKNKLTVQWGLSVATIDLSAKELLAHLFQINTYESAAQHRKTASHLQRAIRSNIDGTRSTHYSLGMAFPPPLTARAFESWLTWSSFRQEDGRIGYICFFQPIGTYDGPHEKRITSKQVEAESTGSFIITSLAPNICRWTRIQSLNLKANIHPSLMALVTRRELRWAGELQERCKRNEAEVDAEMRTALIEILRETELDEDQKATVKYLKGFLEVEKRGKKGGWGHLYSPFAGTKMQIKHKKTKGKRTIVLGRAEGVADCSPEEAAAYFFDYCSNIRNRAAYAKGDITRFEIFKDKGKVNEKSFAAIKRLPHPFSNRELVFKNMYARNYESEDSASVYTLPLSMNVDYGGKGYGRTLVTARTFSFFTATGIESVGEVKQCRMELVQYFDSGGNIILPKALTEKIVAGAMGFLTSCQAAFQVRIEKK
ncbi:hypothetical protein TrCOL_g12870 [Triparma columacea]|uniref:Uncharacterized protein n=1 Tax=Triparma columacea TaxID=722753 RepID=A0A9W7FYR1_9STRA|nr:hypothetical protein TrCOL_g12870 [Triparma columacea]